MKKSLRIVFFGNEKIATGVESEPIVFDALQKAGYDIAALVIHASEITSRKNKAEPIVELAKAHNIPVLNPSGLADEVETIKSFGADIGILVAYGKIIPPAIIDVFPKGIINIHPSLLPTLRGSTPIESALLAGLSSTGASIMQLAAEMDSGPVYAQKVITMDQHITKQELSKALHESGREMILSVLDGIDNLEPEPQDNTKATFCSLISKEDGKLDWNKTAEELERQVRAYAGWPKSYFDHGGIRYIVCGAETGESLNKSPGEITIDEHTIGIQASAGTLYVTTIQPEGKKEMPVRAFLSGYSSRFI